MPWEPIRQDDGFLQESFLVESRSVGGYSGSPVFAFIPPGTIRSGVADWVDKILIHHGPWLLGINWGHINDWQPVCDAVGRPVNPSDPSRMQVLVNTGMMAIVPAWKLQEMFSKGPLTEMSEEKLMTIARRWEGFPQSALK